MKQFTIFQLDIENKKAHDFMYMGYQFIKKHNLKLSLDLYNNVYEGEIGCTTDQSVHQVLNTIYRTFNLSHPADFKGHSLSTSDIVMLDGKYYYCDSYGWEEVHFQKPTKTYKVTYFTKELEVENVITYHNIADQGFLLDTIAINIYTLELADVVKCETAEENYTVAVNELIKGRLARLAA